jgi:thiamine pyrophosphokinase
MRGLYNFSKLNPRSPESMFVNGTVLMLNSPFPLPSFFPLLWTADKFRACADGAINRIFDSAPQSLPPHTIVGDMDSARLDVLRHYEKLGTVVVKRPDQNSTDMEKLLRYSGVDDARLHREGATAVLGGLGGLLSHQMANLNAALAASMPTEYTPFIFLDEQETCIVLGPGKTSFVDVEKGLHCALVPLYGPASDVTTSGLKWNLTGNSLAFGGLVSTSNEAEERDVTIQTDQPLLLIFERRERV